MVLGVCVGPKTELLLWGAIVRIAVTYGTRTLELTERGKQRIDGSAFYCLWEIQDIYRPRKPKKQNREFAYHNEEADNRIAATEINTKSRINANKNAMGYTYPS